MKRRNFNQLFSALFTLPWMDVGHRPHSPSEVAGSSAYTTGCVSWCFHGFGPGVDSTEAIPVVSRLGFDGIQLMINREEDLETIWTSSKVRSTKKQLEEEQLDLLTLAPFYTCYPHLGHADEKLRSGSLRAFDRFCDLARRLGTTYIEVLPPYASEFLDYGNEMFQAPFGNYKLRGEASGADEKIELGVAGASVDYVAIEDRMRQTFASMASMAKNNGLQIILEPHINSFVPDAATYLVYLERGFLDDTYRLNLDTGWSSIQAQYPPMMVHLTARHLQMMQFRDVDRHTRDFVPFGEGVVANTRVLEALEQIDFSGFISFEEVFIPSVNEDAKNFLNFIKPGRR